MPRGLRISAMHAESAIDARAISKHMSHFCTPILADANNNVNDQGNETEPFQKQDTSLLQECNTSVPLMGDGRVMHRNQNYLTSAVKNLLQVEYRKGVANSGRVG
jgi:hypothetical protein